MSKRSEGLENGHNTYAFNQNLQNGSGCATAWRRASKLRTPLLPVGVAIARVLVLPIRVGVATIHLHTLEISAVAMPSMGLVGMYNALDHHLQKARGAPKSVLMAARTESVGLHEPFAEAGAAQVYCPNATSHRIQVMNLVDCNIFPFADQAA